MYSQVPFDLGSKVDNVSRSHSSLTIDKDFKGKEYILKTTHGSIVIEESIVATHLIDINTSHSMIDLKGSLICGQTVRIKSSHGAIRMNKDDSIVAKDLDIKSSHAPLLFNGCAVDAKTVKLETGHNRIVMDNVSVESALTAKSSHGPIDIHIKEIYSDNAKIKVTSSHAPVNVYLPLTFSGSFWIKTSRADASVISSLSEYITYAKDSTSEKVGQVVNLGNKSFCDVRIETSNQPVNLYFQ